MTRYSSHIFPQWAGNLTIYEVNLRQYTPGGTLKEFREHLPRLKELGVGIIWFMPVQPIGIRNRKGSLGSNYSIRDYCAIDESYGSMEEFRDTVKEIHSMGMFVILDWVANHTAWDHRWVSEHPDYYRRNESGEVFPPFPEWSDVVGLDYSNASLREAMIEAMQFWLRTTGIDGFRCDMAHLVPTFFWEQAKPELERTRPGLYMLAETDQYDLLNQAFHSSYDWKVFHAMNELAQGKISLHDLTLTIEEQLKGYPQQASLMRFISNHDENSWQGSELERLAYYLEPLAVLYFTLPGIPLIYSGQEAGNYRRLSFFDKDCIEWKQDKMSVLYRQLSELRKRNSALWSAMPESTFRFLAGSDTRQVMAFERVNGEQGVLVVLNLGFDTVRFTLEGTPSFGEYSDVFNGMMEVRIGAQPCFEMAPFSYRLFSHQNV